MIIQHVENSRCQNQQRYNQKLSADAIENELADYLTRHAHEWAGVSRSRVAVSRRSNARGSVQRRLATAIDTRGWACLS